MTITALSAGTATLTVTARDPGGLSASLSASVMVEEPNRPPVALVPAVPPQTAEVGDTLPPMDVSLFFNDPDGDPLAYGVATTDSSVVAVSVSGSITTARAVGVGTATVTITATDPGGLSASISVMLTVVPANRAPVARLDSVPARTAEVGDSVRLDVSAWFADPDGDTLAYSATTFDPGVLTASVAGDSVVAAAVGAGTATLTIAATDPDGLSASLSVGVTVTRPPNLPPVAAGAIPPQLIRVGETVALNVAPLFTDPNGDELTHSAATSDPGVVAVTATASTVTVDGGIRGNGGR